MSRPSTSSFLLLFLFVGSDRFIIIAAAAETDADDFSNHLVGKYRLQRLHDEDGKEIEIPCKTTLVVTSKRAGGDDGSSSRPLLSDNLTSDRMYVLNLSIRNGNKLWGTATVHHGDNKNSNDKSNNNKNGTASTAAVEMDPIFMTRMRTPFARYEGQLYRSLSVIDAATTLLRLRNNKTQQKMLELDGSLGQLEFRKIPSRGGSGGASSNTTAVASIP